MCRFTRQPASRDPSREIITSTCGSAFLQVATNGRAPARSMFTRKYRSPVGDPLKSHAMVNTKEDSQHAHVHAQRHHQRSPGNHRPEGPGYNRVTVRGIDPEMMVSAEDAKDLAALFAGVAKMLTDERAALVRVATFG